MVFHLSVFLQFALLSSITTADINNSYFPRSSISPLFPLVSSWSRHTDHLQQNRVKSSRHIQLLLSCSFKVLSKNSPLWSQSRKSMLVTGRLLELKLTTLCRICDNLKDVGLVVFKSSGLLFANAFPKFAFKVLWMFKYENSSAEPSSALSMLIFDVLQKPILDYSYHNVLQKLVHFKVKSWNVHVKGHFNCELFLYLELNQNVINSQVSQAVFYHQLLFV